MIKKIILISGKAGTGKSTVAKLLAKLLAKHLLPSMILHFATGVKDVAFKMSWDGEKDARGRRLLQEVGKLGRSYNSNCWAMQVANVIKELEAEDYFIVDDWRFPNEYNYLQQLEDFDIITVHIYAPSREKLKNTAEYSDESETSLDDWPAFDFIIYNENLTIEELEENLKEDINVIKRFP